MDFYVAELKQRPVRIKLLSTFNLLLIKLVHWLIEMKLVLNFGVDVMLE